MKMRIRKNDTVVVISGKDKGKVGKVQRVLLKNNKVVVEGINIVTRHVKPSAQHQKGSLVKSEAPLHRSKVMLYNEGLKKGVRIGHQWLEDGEKVRVCKKTGEAFAAES